MRLPRRVCFPFGYIVSVKLVTKVQMDEAGGEGCDGLWLVEQRRVLIRKRLPAARRRWVLMHELSHAFMDAQHQFAGEGLIRG